MESSRIFVRGLPPRFTEDDVRRHFAKFPVTDVKFFPHRRIGYVGYKTPEDAAKAVKYFNKTFINLTRIHAEIARPVSTLCDAARRGARLPLSQISDKELPKSRRQQRIEKSVPAHDEYIAPLQESALKRKRDQDEQEQDPKLKEFLQVYQAPSKTNIWTNGDSHFGGPVAAAESTAEAAVVPVPVPEDESEDDYQVITKKPRTASEAPKAPASSEPIAGAASTEMGADEALPQEDAVDHDDGPPSQDRGVVSDIDWLRSRTNRVLDLVQDDEQPSLEMPEPEPAPQLGRATSPSAAGQPVEAVQPSVQQAEIDPSTEMDKIRETGRLYLRNLHFDVTEDEIREHFSKFGRLEEVCAIAFHFFTPLAQ
jgi:multiple RNA-binding domain-containing protein 1